MDSTSAAVPLEKTVVLVGAGNAHLVFLKRWGMRPLGPVAVTLVNDAPVIPYSAMVPGHLGGDFTWEQATIDLVRLCQSVKVRLVVAPLTHIAPAARQVHFGSRPPLSYDALSLGLGSLPTCPVDSPAIEVLALRPLAALVKKIDALDARLTRSPQPYHLAVVGAGASGCELALAVHKRLARHPEFRLSVLQGQDRILPEFSGKTASTFARLFEERGIVLMTNARVISSQDDCLVLEHGQKFACHAVLAATQAAPPRVLAASGLAVDQDGFLLVEDTLRSASDPAVFGTGDCVAFPTHPGLPRNGVHAVRQGAVLFDNVRSWLQEKPLRRFRPQRRCLVLLNSADGQAVLNYGPLSIKTRWARKLKDRIDRAWMRKFTEFAPMTPPAADQPEPGGMRCGGCGSKISSDVLSAVLKKLDFPDDPRVLLGARAGEDAAVHRVRPQLFGAEPDKLLEVQTVDYFKAFLDDPYLFGRIAALNAVSDLYAMNARPFSALAIATLPYARGPIQEAQLYELLAGALESFRALGVVLTGGHTTEGNEMALGFAVTGFGEEGRLFQKNQLRSGDCLVLTKPLGSGALLAAWMRGACKAAWFEELMQSMLLANGAAGAAFAEAGVSACTDVTGFGLAGHLLEMLDASKVSARLWSEAVPVYAGFAEVVSEGIRSTLHRDNARMSCRLEGAAPLPDWLFDPQTSGGLLAAVRPEKVAQVLERVHALGYARAAVIGEVMAMAPGGACIEVE